MTQFCNIINVLTKHDKQPSNKEQKHNSTKNEIILLCFNYNHQNNKFKCKSYNILVCLSFLITLNFIMVQF